MQIPTLWKRITGTAVGLGAVFGAVLGWQQLEIGRPAWSTDVEVVVDDVRAATQDIKEITEQVKIQVQQVDRIQGQVDTLTKSIRGMTKLNLYRERDRVEDRIDELYERQEREPSNTALRRLIKLRERERDEIDRQIDELQE